MARIPSAFSGPSERHRDKVPLMFQLVGPTGQKLVEEPLVLHVNPLLLTHTMSARVERIQTRGGWVEQYYGDEIDRISSTVQSGGFVHTHEGLAQLAPWETIAYDRMLDLVDLYKNNGGIHDAYGTTVFQGRVVLQYDNTVYLGYFTNLSLTLTAEKPYSMDGSFEFKVTQVVWRLSTLMTQGAIDA